MLDMVGELEKYGMDNNGKYLKSSSSLLSLILSLLKFFSLSSLIFISISLTDGNFLKISEMF